MPKQQCQSTEAITVIYTITSNNYTIYIRCLNVALVTMNHKRWHRPKISSNYEARSSSTSLSCQHITQQERHEMSVFESETTAPEKEKERRMVRAWKLCIQQLAIISLQLSNNNFTDYCWQWNFSVLIDFHHSHFFHLLWQISTTETVYLQVQQTLKL